MKISQVISNLQLLKVSVIDLISNYSTENYAKKNTNKKKNDARNDKEYENLKQRPNESDRNFMNRVNRVTQESVEEAKFEAKYGVEVVRNKKTGEIKLKKRPPNEIDERLKQNAQNLKHKGRKSQVVSIAPEERKRMAKALIEEKKQKEKEAKTPVIEEFKRDDIKFGEVANAPPQLTVPRLAKKAETVPRVRKKSCFYLFFDILIISNVCLEAWSEIASFTFRY